MSDSAAHSHYVRIMLSVIAPRTLILMLAIAVNLFVCVLWPNSLSSILATAFYFVALAQIFYSNPVGFVLMLPFVIIQTSAIVSLNFIECGAYMNEMAYPGSASIGATSYTLYSLLFLFAGVATFAKLQAKQNIENSARTEILQPLVLIRWLPAAIGILIISYMLARGAVTGFPLITGTDRFKFRRLDADTLTLNFLSLKIIIAAILSVGAQTARTKFSGRLHHSLFIGYLAVSFLYGDKFFILLNATSIYVIPFVIKNPSTTVRSVKRMIPVGTIAIACAFAMTFFVYSDFGSRSAAETMQHLGERISGQGQLWFMAVKDSSSFFHFDAGIVTSNVSNLFHMPSADYAFLHRLGPFYFVEKYSPEKLYVATLHGEGTVTPTMIFEAYGLVAFGYAGLMFLMILTGVGCGYLIDYFARSLITGNMFNVLLPAFILIGAISMMSQGTLYSLFGLSAFKAYAAFLALQIFVQAVIKGISAPNGRGIRRPA